jgi:AcrR family transcriptional regulator
MGRPPLLSNDEILRATRAVFVEHGIRATTAAVAERAGVSEGVLFKRFGSKMGLLRAAADSVFGEGCVLPQVPDVGFTEASFEAFGIAVVDHLRLIVPIAMMAWAHLAEDGIPEHLRGPQPPILRATNEMAAIFARQIELGVFRPGNPQVLARMFCGTLWHTAFLETVFPDRVDLIPNSIFIREFRELVFVGLSLPAHRLTETTQ